MTATIYHNPRCSKSRATLALLANNKAEAGYVVLSAFETALGSLWMTSK